MKNRLCYLTNCLFFELPVDVETSPFLGHGSDAPPEQYSHEAEAKQISYLDYMFNPQLHHEWQHCIST